MWQQIWGESMQQIWGGSRGGGNQGGSKGGDNQGGSSGNQSGAANNSSAPKSGSDSGEANNSSAPKSDSDKLTICGEIKQGSSEAKLCYTPSGDETWTVSVNWK
ncbi:hypothetical protein SLEP1_g58814 [Rubroshorea leprosula]|uniref:Uncharacterized protein n=1 Tax=Rubroshorea leprosula TaxID=152421 RepID=A0AAV5MTB5_9ROSI|nr:hypothetical protein SLEP1_g58814 [Rubroshorea leprosula]